MLLASAEADEEHGGEGGDDEDGHDDGGGEVAFREAVAVVVLDGIRRR